LKLRRPPCEEKNLPPEKINKFGLTPLPAAGAYSAPTTPSWIKGEVWDEGNREKRKKEKGRG